MNQATNRHGARLGMTVLYTTPYGDTHPAIVTMAFAGAVNLCAFQPAPLPAWTVDHESEASKGRESWRHLPESST